tara:strand:- start:17747 stop:18301 length:555 start_codon:yes stop_codon:yes gene_type:complete
MNNIGNPALVLNADFRPLSYFPLSLWSWQDTIKAVCLKRVNIISEYESEVHSPSMTMKIPSVISLKEYVAPQRYPAFTRFNVFLRDNFSCQYCCHRFPAKYLSFDHLIPKSRGGRTAWNNVVSACTSCNFKKGNRMLEETDMQLLQFPTQPSATQLHRNGKKFPSNYLHKSWHDYLYWDTELEN